MTKGTPLRMRASEAVTVPQLSILLGSEAVLSTLQREWAAFPQGASYADFRRLLEQLVRPPPDPSATQQPRCSTLERTTPPHYDTPASSRFEAAITPARLSEARASTPGISTYGASDGTGTNREAERARRIRSRQELAGVTMRSVDPIKQLFNRVDIHNEQRVTWDNLVNYLVAEATSDATATRLRSDTFNYLTFSRQLRGLSKQPQQQRKPQERLPPALRIYRRYYRDVQGFPKSAAAVRGDESATGGGQAAAVICEDEDLALVRFIDGLPGHKSLFFACTRSCPCIFYSKDTLERVYSAPPELLPGVSPTAVSYLAACDLFVCYSADDRLLRGWFSLISHTIVTVAVTPLLLEGLVRRIYAMPHESPTYAEYAETVFVGNSQGQVLRITAPQGRSGGMEFTVAQTYSHLHSIETGGLVDFCVYGAHLYSLGFDGRLVVTSLHTGQSSEVGRVVNEHLTTLVYIPEHDWVVAATSCRRQLLCWEANAHGSLPGSPFIVTGHGEHEAVIIALVYVAPADLLVSADSQGVLKVWDASSQRCVQSLRSNRIPRRHGGSLRAVTADEAKASFTKTRTAANTNSGLLAGNLAGLFLNLGLLALLPAGVGQPHQVGGLQCHSLTYCEPSQEMLCGFVNSIVCWGLRDRANLLVCDAEEACYDLLYDIRTCTFLVQGATCLSVWDGVDGYRRRVLGQVENPGALQAGSDIKAMCLDELGSRLFVSLSDGRVVSYTTQYLASDASKCTPVRAPVWWRGRSPGCGVGSGGPALVEQMHYSSISRTWIAITSMGALLVRSEEDEQKVLFSITISVSTSPLTHLRVSEDLGLTAVTDAQRTVYMYDMQAWMDAPVTKKLAEYGALVDIVFLADAPALVTVHAGGVCRCWSCAPAKERFQLISVFCHPQHPAPELVTVATVEAERASMEAMERAHLGSAGMTRGRRPMQPAAASQFARTAAVRASGCHDVLHSASCDTPRYRAMLPTIARISRPSSGGIGSRPATSTLRASPRGFSSSQRIEPGVQGTSDEQREDPVEPRSALKCHARVRKAANGPLRNAKAGEEYSATAVAAPIPIASVEFTSAAYDGRQHHLFLGDSDGVVHTYRMCPLLQAFKLPRCTHTSRPTFSLSSAMEASGMDADSALAFPTLVWSLQVHVNDRSTRERGGEAHPPSTNRGSISSVTQRGLERCGVLCVRWMDDRGVLASSGYDHKVWFLDSMSGEKIASLSAARPPPRPDRAGSPLMVWGHDSGALAQEPILSGVLEKKKTEAASTLPLHNIFSLPPLPRYDGLTDGSAAHFLAGTPPPCCCTHITANEEATATEGLGVLASQSKEGQEEDCTPATVSSARPLPVSFSLPTLLGHSNEISRSLSRCSIPEVAMAARHDRAAVELKGFLQRPIRQSSSGTRPPRINPYMRSPSPSSSEQYPPTEDARRGRVPPSHYSVSSPAGNPLEADESPCGAPSATWRTRPTSGGNESAHVHIVEWQKRHLIALRASRGMKPDAPVHPGSHNTLVHVEESKWHSVDVTGQPPLLGSASGVPCPAVRPAVASTVALAATQAAASQTDAASGWSALSRTANMPTLMSTRGDSVAMEAERSGSIISLGFKEDSAVINPCETATGSFSDNVAIVAAEGLHISGSAMAAPALDADQEPAARPPQQTQLLQSQREGERIKRNSVALFAMPRYGNPSRVPPRHRSAPGHHSRTSAPRFSKKAAECGGVGERTSSSAVAGASASCLLHGIAEGTQSFVSSNTTHPPPMLAYSNECEGRSTLEMYSIELRKRLRRPRRWYEA
ncbi:hypothetical protein LSCM1_01070 [Leishmania martiniquensis]|uniref:Guanine nucleotide-binding protein subunit beta-like protein n=1 Tax=Leishmania martiniquensis TaxID=1580590 RepID=A0A836GN47_9TRYP|nr:hypothetical protein LSCM1_01070 [Leishmania martiniquensis]